MVDKKKEHTDKIADITDDKELNEADLQEVSGGMLPSGYRTRLAGSDDCGGNCMGTVKSATGKDIEL